MPIPALPISAVPWSANAVRAHGIVNNTYVGGTIRIREQDSNPVRLKSWVDKLEANTPIIEAFRTEGLPDDWVNMVMEQNSLLAAQLREMQQGVEGM